MIFASNLEKTIEENVEKEIKLLDDELTKSLTFMETLTKRRAILVKFASAIDITIPPYTRPDKK